jgi:hypothetical protein
MAMKQRKSSDVNPAKAGIQEQANGYLREIAIRTADIEALHAECEEAIQEAKARYALRIEARDVLLKSAVTALMQTMKFNKKILFDGTDVVNLPHGSLIHSVKDKVSIPRDALAKCEELGFDEVVKIAKSLDREAVEKWRDEKLFLIGAERKPKEEFSYDLKKE